KADRLHQARPQRPPPQRRLSVEGHDPGSQASDLQRDRRANVKTRRNGRYAAFAGAGKRVYVSGQTPKYFDGLRLRIVSLLAGVLEGLLDGERLGAALVGGAGGGAFDDAADH